MRKGNGRVWLALGVTVVALVSLASCMPVLSLRPLYTEKDIFFDPQLLGKWTDSSPGDHSVMVFERLNTNGYTVTLSDSTDKTGETYIYQAHLVKLGNRIFMDAVQSDLKVGGESVAIMAVPGHMLGRVELGPGRLNVSFLDNRWLEEAMERGAVSLRHETSDDGTPILTATTAELQRFVLDHADDDEAFSVKVGPLQGRK